MAKLNGRIVRGVRWWRALVATAALTTVVAACGRTNQPRQHAAAGTSGGAGASGAGGGGAGITISEAPPFGLPALSLPTLVPCDSMAVPEPVGFLADGRPVVIQRLENFEEEPAGDLLRVWDPSTSALETLLVTKRGAGVQLRDGRLFERFSSAAGEPGYRTHDLGHGAASSSAIVAVQLSAISGDGRFVLDKDLRRLTASGDFDLDFAPLLSERARARASRVALSFTGDAVAAAFRDFETQAWNVELSYDDGRVLQLADAPDLASCCEDDDDVRCGHACGLFFSPDGGHLLGVGRGQLRVWDTASAAIVLNVDGPDLQAASFVHGGDRLLVVSESGTSEQALDGSQQLPVGIDDPKFATGPNAVLGYVDGALAVVARDQVTARWWQPRQTWHSAVAVTEDAAFAIVPDPEFEAIFSLMVARYEPDRAGPTALFSPREAQSEWVGQIELSPDGRSLAVVFPDSVRVLDTASFELLVTLPTGAGQVAWSPDGRYLATSPDLHYRDADRPAYAGHKTLDFWDAASGELAARYATPVHTHAFAFSADGAKVAAWGQDVAAERAEPVMYPVTRLVPVGEVRSFGLDVLGGRISDSALGPIIGSTRELVATEQGVFRVSTGEPVSLFERLDAAQPPPRLVAFAPDASFGVIAFDELTQARLFAVSDANRASGAPLRGSRQSLALAAGARRIAVGQDIYCATTPPQ